MNDRSGELAAASELRATRLLLAGIICVALMVLLLFLPRIIDAVSPDGSSFAAAVQSVHGAWFAAVAACVLGFWARAAAPARSPSRGTGLVLGIVGLVLTLLLGFFIRGGP
ncbi:MAG TPA: hypothetical protein VGB85_09975 [Nannocystis sp.]